MSQCFGTASRLTFRRRLTPNTFDARISVCTMLTTKGYDCSLHAARYLMYDGALAQVRGFQRLHVAKLGERFHWPLHTTNTVQGIMFNQSIDRRRTGCCSGCALCFGAATVAELRPFAC